MKNKMFKIVGAFSFFVAVIALLVSIGLGLLGSKSFLSSPDKNINSPAFRVEDYIVYKTSSDAQNSDPSSNRAEESNKKDDEENKAYQNSLSELFDKVFKSINNFATITNQNIPTKEGLEVFLLAATKATTPDEYLIFLRSLGNDLESLESRAKNVASISPSDYCGSSGCRYPDEYIEWERFISWYSFSYMENLNNEKARIALEEIKAQAKSAEGLTMLMTAGSMFTVFVFFVLIMLLVQIESNTRKQGS